MRLQGSPPGGFPAACYVRTPTGGVFGSAFTGPPGSPGTKWWHGTGAPGTITGSNPGDLYLDTNTGLVYQLS